MSSDTAVRLGSVTDVGAGHARIGFGDRLEMQRACERSLERRGIASGQWTDNSELFNKGKRK